jgi:hypothetical protein
MADGIILMLGAITAMLTALTALVTALATLLWTWRQQTQISKNAKEVRTHLKDCPANGSRGNHSGAGGQPPAPLPGVPPSVRPSV